MPTPSVLLALVAAISPAVSLLPPEGPHPHPRQLAWQRYEMTMFVHFGPNTFTGVEWGHGNEDPNVFHPTDLDARQWARAAKSAGMKLVILTAKHHDGFCLWPSKLTRHSVAGSAWRDGKGDVVREFVTACRAEGLRVGLYLSPWDQNAPTYATPAYNDFFVGQLTELLTNYGRIDEVWFDGAMSDEARKLPRVYDWDRYHATVRRLAPQAVIAISGPDVRWVGNESGFARPDESSVVRGENDAPDRWYPAECDVSIRPGWFYHASEDARVKSLSHLMRIYFESVGRNSGLLLNVPPDPRGRFADVDVARLKEFGDAVRALNALDLMRGAKGPRAVMDGRPETFWSPPKGARTGDLTLHFGREIALDAISLREDIRVGERVRRYRVEADRGGRWTTVRVGTVIGHRQLIAVPGLRARRLRLVIEDAAAIPRIAEFTAHRSPYVPAMEISALSLNRPVRVSSVHHKARHTAATARWTETVTRDGPRPTMPLQWKAN